jgi:hypothetical protein
MMRTRAPATSVRGRSIRLYRYRKQGSEQGDQQEKSGRPTLHDVVEAKPQVDFEHSAERAVGQASGAKRPKFTKTHKSNIPTSGKTGQKWGTPVQLR